MELKTVNVVEYADDSVLGVHSFEDNPEGNKEAEECFKTIVKQNGDKITDEEMEVFLEDGYYEAGSYQLFLTHST